MTMQPLKTKKKHVWEFTLGSIEDLKKLAGSLSIDIEAAEDISILAEPVKAGGLTIPNSLAVHPMEGCDADSMGRPGKLTLRRYERFTAGGAGLIWSEAVAVVPEGRANPRQLWLHEGSQESFKVMIKKMRDAAAKSMGPEHKPVLAAQLTHSGRYSKPEGIPHPIIPQRDPYRDPLIPQFPPDLDGKTKIPFDWPLVTNEYLDKLQDAYVVAARLAFEAGFDAVDIKACHGYLVNELLACRNRAGKYGGSFENRTRFLLEVIDKIQAQLGKDKPVVTRLGIYDAIPYPYGWAVDKKDYTKPDLTEPKKLIRLLEERGIKIINITVGNPYYNPHLGRPFNEPVVGGYDEQEHPLIGVSRMINLAAEIQKEFPDIAFIGTGYTWLRTLFPNVAAAYKSKKLITLIGVGRMSFAYPDFARDIIFKKKLDERKVCVGCSACTQLMRYAGTAGCVVRDNKVYGPIFKYYQCRDKDNLLWLADKCRYCQEPVCQLACPAGINIPKFISQFLDGEEKAAYETIRQSNIFPEICAWLCPVEQQCQGACLQGLIGDSALPIADIQRYLAEQANKNGWSKLRLPEKTTGKKAAVIGAGPAGLAAAVILLEAGHSVTIFDKNTCFGGMIEQVIPIERQAGSLKNEIAAVFKDAPKDRLILQLGKELSRRFNLDTIMRDNFDAVFIGIGLPDPVALINKKLDGLWDALKFLAATKNRNKDKIENRNNNEKIDNGKNREEERGQNKDEGRNIDFCNKTVGIIGGGNTAMDTALTAKDLGAADVYIIYRRSFVEMPAWNAERDRALNKGIHFLILTQLLDYIEQDGKLTGIKVCPTRLAEPDVLGRRRPENIESSAYDLDMDIVIEAIGQKSAEGLENILPGVKFKKDFIQTKEGSYQTSRPKVFAGGDLIHGASTVVSAVSDGMKAAKEINRLLA